MNGIANAADRNYAPAGVVANGKAADSQRTAAGKDNAAANRAAAPAYRVEISEEALRKAKEFIEQVCKQQGIDIDSLDGPFSSLHAEEVAKRTDGTIKIITGEDISRRHIKMEIEDLLRKSNENGGVIESGDMFDPLIHQMNAYNGYEGDLGFFDKVLKELQEKDPERKSDIISKMKDLFEQAQSGQYIYTKSERLQKEQRIKDVKNAIEINDSQIDAMQEKLKKLNEKLMALQKEALSDEEKRSKTKPIEEQIESINEQLAELYAKQRMLPEKLTRVSADPVLR